MVWADKVVCTILKSGSLGLQLFYFCEGCWVRADKSSPLFQMPLWVVVPLHFCSAGWCDHHPHGLWILTSQLPQLNYLNTHCGASSQSPWRGLCLSSCPRIIPSKIRNPVAGVGATWEKNTFSGKACHGM